MSKDERVKEIRKAIGLLGWVSVRERIRSSEDRAIFDELSEEFMTREKARLDKILKEHHIEF